MSIETIGVIGAGTMGKGIAQVAATTGLTVILIDISAAAVDKAVGSIGQILERQVAKGKLTTAGKAAALDRIHGETTYEALRPADLVIESATEDMATKIEILKKIAPVIRPDTIVASNTSSVSITHLAAALPQPERCIGMHFFNPVPVMALVEVVNALQTSQATHEAVETLAKRLGKTPITVKSSPGFVVNRLLLPMLNEAFFVLAEGNAKAEDIDAGMRLGCNHPIGPLALADLIGLDVLLSVMKTVHEEFGDPKYRPAPLLKELVAAGRLGRKVGRGVYQYG